MCLGEEEVSILRLEGWVYRRTWLEIQNKRRDRGNANQREEIAAGRRRCPVNGKVAPGFGSSNREAVTRMPPSALLPTRPPFPRVRLTINVPMPGVAMEGVTTVDEPQLLTASHLFRHEN